MIKSIFDEESINAARAVFRNDEGGWKAIFTAAENSLRERGKFPFIKTATDEILKWDGIGEIFDHNCKCEKCCLARQAQRDRAKL